MDKAECLCRPAGEGPTTRRKRGQMRRREWPRVLGERTGRLSGSRMVNMSWIGACEGPGEGERGSERQPRRLRVLLLDQEKPLTKA